MSFPALDDSRFINLLDKLYDCYPNNLYVGGSFATYWSLPVSLRSKYLIYDNSDIDIFIPANTVTAVDNVLLENYCGLKNLNLTRSQYGYKMPHIRKVLAYWSNELNIKINIIYLMPDYYKNSEDLMQVMGHSLAQTFYVKTNFGPIKKESHCRFYGNIETGIIGYKNSLLTGSALTKLKTRADLLGFYIVSK